MSPAGSGPLAWASSRRRVDAILTTAKRRCGSLPSLSLRIGWLAGSQGAIRFTALPVQALAELRHALIVATAVARGHRERRSALDGYFWPHVSIAYCNAHSPVAARLAPLRACSPVPVKVAAVHLAELRREGRGYRWHVIERVPLCRDS
ncbi:MAG: 2'-5' RNA ligase family protein [Pseudonocardiaceae bacterium]